MADLHSKDDKMNDDAHMILTPIAPEARTYTNAAAAVARLQELYSQATEFLIGHFTKTVTTGKPQTHEKLAVFAGVHKDPARVKCAILPWHAVVAALDGATNPVSTETENT